MDGRLWFPRIDYETGKILNHHQTELDAFYGGLLGQGGDMKDGRAYTLSWAVVQDKFGVLPEGFDYKSPSRRPHPPTPCARNWPTPPSTSGFSTATSSGDASAAATSTT